MIIGIRPRIDIQACIYIQRDVFFATPEVSSRIMCLLSRSFHPCMSWTRVSSNTTLPTRLFLLLIPNRLEILMPTDVRLENRSESHARLP